MRQVLAKFLKTFLMLYGGKSLLGMLIARRFDLKRLANHDSANFAMAIAGMRATYYGLIISPDWRRILGEYHVSLSAAFASLWLLIDRSPQRRVYIALTLSIKAALFYTRSLIYQAPESPEFEGQTELRAYQLIHRKSPWLNASSQLIHRHGTLLVWYIVAFHVTLTSYNYPHLLPKSYYNSLVELTGLKGKYGRDLPAVTEALQYFTDLSSKGLHPEVFKVPDGITSVNFLKSLSQNNEEWSVRAQNAFIPISSRMSPSAHHSRLMCMLQHPENTSCLTAAAQGGVDVFSFAFKNYAVINGATFMYGVARRYFSKRKPHKDHTIAHSAVKSLESLARACVMLCSYMAVLTGTLCALRQILGAEYKLSYGLGGIIAGTTILLESPGRLLELNSYALEKCINSIFVHLRNINVFQGINKGEILYFIPTMALLANSIEKHPHTVHGISEPILRWLFPKTA